MNPKWLPSNLRMLWSSPSVDWSEYTPVQQTQVIHVGFTGFEPQEITVSQCVTSIQCDAFWGSFSLLDDQKRVIQRSEDGAVELKRDELKHDVATVTYDLLSKGSALWNELKEHGHEDPGIDLSGSSWYIRWDEVLNEGDSYPHVPMLLQVSNFWNNTSQKLWRS